MKGGLSVYTYQPTNFTDIQDQVEAYAANFSSPADSFWEETVLKASFYTISVSGAPAGYFALYEYKILVLFVMDIEFLKHSQAVFADVISKYHVKEALAPTCDELLMSLCLDTTTDIERQAYFFQDSGVSTPPELLYDKGTFRQAVPEEHSQIAKATGFFFDQLEERIARQEIFIWQEEDTIIGAGVVERGIIFKGYASIGMFTHPDYRQKGVGRSILEELKKWCYENEFKPIAGCWYYNHYSKRSVESIGMVTVTRLMRFFFSRSEA